MGGCCLFGSFLKITEMAQFCGLLFPRLKLCIKKMGWATFWAISQTHLVTLLIVLLKIKSLATLSGIRSSHPRCKLPNARPISLHDIERLLKSKAVNTMSLKTQGCQIFLAATYQNRGKYTK
jgi:hypothetical protein